jgi:SAM-dependent methyltransferase
MIETAELQGLVEQKWSGRASSFSELIHEELNCHKKDAWLKEIDSLASFPNGQSPRVLDLGTGPGFFAIILSQRGWRATGVDCSPEMLSMARANAAKQGTEPDFLLMDNHKLNFPDDSFDLLISRNVTWTLYDPVAAYKEWGRVLRPGGSLLVFDANWFRHVFYEEDMERRRKAQKEALERFNLKPFKEEDPEMARVLYSSLPMGRYLRPGWDQERLAELGFKDIRADQGLSARVLDEEEQAQYSDTPMFSIRAVKPLATHVL